MKVSEDKIVEILLKLANAEFDIDETKQALWKEIEKLKEWEDELKTKVIFPSELKKLILGKSKCP